MLRYDWLGLLEALPEIRNAGIFFPGYETEESEPDGMSNSFKFLCIIGEAFVIAGCFNIHNRYNSIDLSVVQQGLYLSFCSACQIGRYYGTLFIVAFIDKRHDGSGAREAALHGHDLSVYA